MRALWITTALVFAADQASKYAVVHAMSLDRLRAIDIAPPWFNLRMAWNRGVNFGLFSGEEDLIRWVLIGVALAICLWVWIWLRRARAGLWARIAGGLLIGGALGNVVDRVIYGAVADFINMGTPWFANPFSFNIADVAIFLGAAGLVFLPARDSDRAI